MEAEIRKRRKQEIYDRQEARRKVIEGIAIFFGVVTVIGFIIGLIYLYKLNN